MGDVLLAEADVDEDQPVVELDGKYVGDAFGNAHRCESAAVEVVDMTNRPDLWKHDRNPSFRKLIYRLRSTAIRYLLVSAYVRRAER